MLVVQYHHSATGLLVTGVIVLFIAVVSEAYKAVKLHMKLILKSQEKAAIFSQIEDFLASCNLRIVGKDEERPWGGFFVIDELQAQEFAKLFFPDAEISTLRVSGKLSPKVLIIQPSRRLSWQYHHRRAEIWRVISGKVGVVTSHTDLEENRVELSEGESIKLAQGQRHRLMGLSDWCVIAEIWQHTDRDHPSDEEDIIRLQDDFGR